MGIVFLLQVNQFGAEVAYGAVLIGEILNGQVADDRYLSASILHYVEVAIEQTGHTWGIGDDRRHFVEIEAV